MVTSLDTPTVTIALTVIIGFVLWAFTPTLNTFRESTLATLGADQLLAQIALQGFIPFVWIIYLIVCALAIRGATA